MLNCFPAFLQICSQLNHTTRTISAYRPHKSWMCGKWKMGLYERIAFFRFVESRRRIINLHKIPTSHTTWDLIEITSKWERGMNTNWYDCIVEWRKNVLLFIVEWGASLMRISTNLSVIEREWIWMDKLFSEWLATPKWGRYKRNMLRWARVLKESGTFGIKYVWHMGIWHTDVWLNGLMA